MPRYEVVIEIKWTGDSRFPVYLEASSEAEAMELARYGDYSDTRPGEGDLEIEEVKVESVQEEARREDSRDA